MTKQESAICVRLPSELHRQLKFQVIRENTTIQQMIVDLLKAKLGQS